MAGTPAIARVASHPRRSALDGIGGGVGRAKSLSLVAFQVCDRAKSAEQYQVRFRPGEMDAWSDTAARGVWLAYIDFASQEIGIAAALSGDERMAEGYWAGDPYMAFAKAAKLFLPTLPRRRTN